MKKLFLISMLSVFLAGCALNQPFTFKVGEPDKFNPNEKHYYTSKIAIEPYNFINPYSIYMRLNYYQNNSKGNWYLTFSYHGDKWFFMEGIDLLINGNKVSFQRQDMLDMEINKISGVDESMTIFLPEYVMEAISLAKTLSIRVKGKKRFHDKDFTPQEIQNFAYFYKEVKRRLNE